VLILVLAVGLALAAALTATAGAVYDVVVEADGIAALDHPALDAAKAARTPQLTTLVRPSPRSARRSVCPSWPRSSPSRWGGLAAMDRSCSSARRAAGSLAHQRPGYMGAGSGWLIVVITHNRLRLTLRRRDAARLPPDSVVSAPDA
jgi:hypothetical protein